MTSTPIDEQRFLDAYLEQSGEPYGRAVPWTLEAFFDGLHDPDDFYSSTASCLYAALASVERRDIALAADPLPSHVTVLRGTFVLHRTSPLTRMSSYSEISTLRVS